MLELIGLQQKNSVPACFCTIYTRGNIVKQIVKGPWTQISLFIASDV